jgi:exopolysaccharide biosynthesis predicted pyruvyltransferase EpsI
MDYQEINIDQFLKQYTGKRIYYCANPGNAGDALIAFATHQVFKRNGIEFKKLKWNKTVKNKIVFYGGGGNLRRVPLLTKVETASIHFLRNNVYQNEEFIILPHTINAYADVLLNAPAHLKIICREKTSYQFVYHNFPYKNNIFLSRDMAFNINYELYKKPGTGILNCFRNDIERTEIIPPSDNNDLSRNWGSGGWSNNQSARKIANNFIEEISKYEQINTNRLHVAIVGAMIGKRVNLYPNSYYKNKSIYEYSMKKYFSNVKFVNKVT